MSQQPTHYNISNEQLFLIDMLKQMYNDNIHQITNMINQITNISNSINNIRNNNSQIRNLLVQILLYPTQVNSNRTNTSQRNDRRNQRHNNAPRENLGRVILDNVPYVIDSIQQYRLPFTNTNTTNTTTSNNPSEQERNNVYTRFMQNFFQPIEIYPTQAQIEAATRNVCYCDIVNPINRECPISLETFTDTDMVSVIRFCGHIFKTNQLHTWFRSNCRCPVCRYDIRNYNSNSSQNYFEEAGPSLDVSNNSIELEPERETQAQAQAQTQAQTTSPSTPNTLNSYIDLILDNTFSEFTNISDASDPMALITLLGALNRRQ